jgi:hypothetical protein
MGSLGRSAPLKQRSKMVIEIVAGRITVQRPKAPRVPEANFNNLSLRRQQRSKRRGPRVA